MQADDPDVCSLGAFVKAGCVHERLYARFYGRKDATLKAPDKPLLYVQNLPARALEKALHEAGIPKHTAEGKIDFHACRVAYITLVIGGSGVSVKEAQTLARHATPDLTMGLYAKAQEDRLAHIVEQVALTLQQAEACVTCVQRGQEEFLVDSATNGNTKRYFQEEVVENTGFEPVTSALQGRPGLLPGYSSVNLFNHFGIFLGSHAPPEFPQVPRNLSVGLSVTTDYNRAVCQMQP